MKELSQLLAFFCIYNLVIDLRGADARCVVPEVPHSRRAPSAARVNSQVTVIYTCVTPFIYMHGSLTITCTDKGNVFDKEPPVCGLPEYVLNAYVNWGIIGGSLKGYRPSSRCLQACNDDPTCDAVDWDGMCWFHYSFTSCSDLTFGKNLQHYQMKQCPVIQKSNQERKEVKPEALTGQVPVAVAISGWISTAVVLILVGVVVVVIKRRIPATQPFVNADHSDTSELHQTSSSPPDSAGRDHEYISLEANNMPTASRVAEYTNASDSDYTVLRTAANETNDRHPTPADADHFDTSELSQNSLSPPNSTDREREYMSLDAKTMATDNNVTGYVNANDSVYTVLDMPANESNQRNPTPPDIYQN